MKLLGAGEFYGITNETIKLEGLTLTDTEYAVDSVDWHYHEKAYLTFIIAGHIVEGNKKEIYHCVPGTLLFHHWQEPHYNIKPKGYTRGFQIEFDRNWFHNYGLNTGALQGSSHMEHPKLKRLMYTIFQRNEN